MNQLAPLPSHSAAVDPEGTSPTTRMRKPSLSKIALDTLAGILTQVDSGRPLMIQSVIEIETDHVSSGDRDSGCRRCRVYIAGNIGRSDVRHWRVVDRHTNGGSRCLRTSD